MHSWGKVLNNDQRAAEEIEVTAVEVAVCGDGKSAGISAG